MSGTPKKPIELVRGLLQGLRQMHEEALRTILLTEAELEKGLAEKRREPPKESCPHEDVQVMTMMGAKETTKYCPDCRTKWTEPFAESESDDAEGGDE